MKKKKQPQISGSTFQTQMDRHLGLCGISWDAQLSFQVEKNPGTPIPPKTLLGTWVCWVALVGALP